MRTLWIMGVGVLGLIAVFWLTLHPVQVLTDVALVPFFLLIAGQLFLPRSNRSLQVWFNPKILIELGDGESVEFPIEEPIRLSGAILHASCFKQWHEFSIVPRRFWLLFLLGAASLAAAGAVQSVTGSDFGVNGIGSLYLVGPFWMLCVSLAWRWLRERRTLRMSGLALGSFSVSGHHPVMRSIRYQFVDHEGEYRGGTFQSMFCDQSDDLTLIFYNEADPDMSVPASAFVFHRLVWKEIPPRPAPASDAAGAGGAG